MLYHLYDGFKHIWLTIKTQKKKVTEADDLTNQRKKSQQDRSNER